MDATLPKTMESFSELKHCSGPHASLGEGLLSGLLKGAV